MPPDPRVEPVRPLLGLVGMQGLGMFSDTLLKMAVVLVLVGPQATEAAQQEATSWGFLAYTAPYVLLSIPAGLLADWWSKRRVLLVLKAAEIAVMLLMGLALADGRPWTLLSGLVLLGTLSALASPAKYGLLPELLPESRLVRGNGLFILVSWLATIVGTGLAGLSLDVLGPARRGGLGVALAALAVGGLLLARRIPQVPAAGAKRAAWDTALAGWREIRGNRGLRLAVQGSVTFWSLGALLQQDVIVYSKTELVLSDTAKGLLQAAIAVGIGAGGLLCGYLTRGRLGVRWIHRGAAAMGALLLVLGLVVPGTVLTTLVLFGVGMCSGLIVVPLNALAQARSGLATRGAVIAVLNTFVFAGILLGSVAGAVLGALGQRSTTIFLVAGGVALAGAVWARTARARLEEPLPTPAA